MANLPDNAADSAKTGTGIKGAMPTMGAMPKSARACPGTHARADLGMAPIEPVPFLPDGVSVRRWFLFYVVFLAAAVLAIVMLLDSSGEVWGNWALVWQKFCGVLHGHSQPRPTWHEFADAFQRAFALTAPAIKLLVVVIYLSMATTLTPLPTGWIVAGLATQGAAIAADVWSVTLIVGLAGALGSTVANMNDYYFWTWLLRSRRVAKVRTARWYAAAAKWFARSPFMILTIFNFIPIPVDVIRLLAITYRYSRLKFAAANFIGRFVRYAVFAFVTYWFHLGWIAPVALLALAAVLGIVKMLHSAWRRVRPTASH